jgi:hypothetical protein
MTSVLRTYSRRNNNTTTVIPDNSGRIVLDPRYTGIFHLDMSTATGITGETVNYTDNAGQGITATNQTVYHFYVFVDRKTAIYYPGLEFKLFFNNITHDENSWISLDNCGILSPPRALFNYDNLSITATSDGNEFTVTATGPQAWSYGPFN